MLSQGFGDLLTGSKFKWENYMSSFIGGAVAGETLLYTGNPYAAGAVQGALTNASNQGLRMLTGKQDEFKLGSFATDTAFSTAMGRIPGNRITGITTGRNSFNAIYNQMATKRLLGNIHNYQTASKMFFREIY